MSTVLVTGASGFVGTALVDDLTHRGFRVIAAVRSRDKLPGLPSNVTPALVTDASRKRSWNPILLEGVDAVVHLIGRAHAPADGGDALDVYREVNVGITSALLDSSEDAGVDHFIYMSSIKAYGEGGDVSLTEASSPAPQDAYGISKLEAERLIETASSRARMNATVVRPPLVYGPGVRGNFLRLMQAVARGVPLPLGSAHAHRSMVYVRNLADAVAALLRSRSDSPFETFNVTDGQDVSVRELVESLGAHLERPPRLIPVSLRVLELAGAVTGTSGEVRRLVRPFSVSSQKLRSQLAWTPPYTLEEGLADTAKWFVDEYRVPRRQGLAGPSEGSRPDC